MNSIGDLHCDLLLYLVADPSRSACDSASRCSLLQLKEGRVAFQTLPLFALTQEGSSEVGAREFDDYLSLPYKYPKQCRFASFPFCEKDVVQLTYAIENASAFAEEKEPLEKVIERLERMIERAGPPLYISMTWKEENRFGGGDEKRSVGLKKDGEALLHYLDGKGIAIDLSHTSDLLAGDILSTIDKYSLEITPIASHSNLRQIAPHHRNLPDEFAQEIARRNGVIGLNFVRHFVGSSIGKLIDHIDHAEKLGILDILTFGADFFDDTLIASKSELLPYFFCDFDNSSCYPHVASLFRKNLTEKIIQDISLTNLLNFFQRQKK